MFFNKYFEILPINGYNVFYINHINLFNASNVLEEVKKQSNVESIIKNKKKEKIIFDVHYDKFFLV